MPLVKKIEKQPKVFFESLEIIALMCKFLLVLIGNNCNNQVYYIIIF